MQTDNLRVSQLSWMRLSAIEEQREDLMMQLGLSTAAADHELSDLEHALAAQLAAVELTLTAIHNVAKRRLDAND